MPEAERGEVLLRPAAAGDCLRMWEWRNDPDTRQASLTTEPIPYASHERWFTARLNDPGWRMFIVTDSRGRDLGYVRFDLRGEPAWISVAIAKEERGKGYGVAAIRKASDRVLDAGLVKVAAAYVRRDNDASLLAFRHAGFRLVREAEVDGVQVYELRYGGGAGRKAARPSASGGASGR